MRTSRILGEGPSCYHCMSRVVDRRFIFGDPEKEYFRRLMRRLEAFTGVEVLTYALMSNHFHLLLHLPEPAPLTDTEFAERIHACYAPAEAMALLRKLDAWRAEGREDLAADLRARYEARMNDLSVFMKELKQGFSQWYNRKNKRKGTLWEERFKSVLVDHGAALAGNPASSAILMMASYIDLNPVRAGLCTDPKDYRFCGYGEALGGSEQARAGLGTILQVMGRSGAWSEVHAAYRLLLFGRGEAKGLNASGDPLHPGFSAEAVAQVFESGGQLTTVQLLRCRVRYFSDGAVLGSKAFVDAFYRRNRERFGPKRSSGARPLRHADWSGLCTLRDLRGTVLSPPTG